MPRRCTYFMIGLRGKLLKDTGRELSRFIYSEPQRGFMSYSFQGDAN